MFEAYNHLDLVWLLPRRIDAMGQSLLCYLDRLPEGLEETCSLEIVACATGEHYALETTEDNSAGNHRG